MRQTQTRPVGVRLPVDIDEHIKAHAASSQISYTDALVALVKRGLGIDDAVPPPDVLADIMARLEALESASYSKAYNSSITYNGMPNEVSNSMPRKRYRRSLVPPGTPGLVALCEAHGIESQAELAKRSGLPVSTIRHNWLATNLPAASLARIADALGSQSE